MSSISTEIPFLELSCAEVLLHFFFVEAACSLVFFFIAH